MTLRVVARISSSSSCDLQVTMMEEILGVIFVICVCVCLCV